jgi:ABC-2 type transport system permease protein
VRLFFSFARQAFHTSAIYSFDFWLRVFNTFIMMYTAHWLWRVLYTQRANAFDISMEQMITYGALAMLMEMALRPGNWVQYYMMEKVRTGEIAMDLIKPLDFHLHMLARNVGEVLFFMIVLGIPCFVFGHLLLGLQLPPDLMHGLLFLISLVLAYLVLFSLSFLLGLLPLFAIRVDNVFWAYNSVVRFFSGSLVPLWLFPAALAKIAVLLPFQAIFAIPLTIYIGKLPVEELTGAISLQFVWVAVLLGLGRLLWNRAHARLVLQGG